jgi:hypothetical protein
MSSSDLIRRPVIGSLQLALIRTVMRIANAAPALKRRVLQNVMRVRGKN